MVKKMKIGIITLIGMDNHGNRLQNYALEQVLKDMGHDVKTIYVNRQTNPIKRTVYRYFSYNGKLEMRNIDDICREHNFRKFSKMNSFYIQYGNNGIIDKEVNEKFDYFIVGSDQVWNPFFWDKRSKSDEINYLLSFANPSKRVSYAASIGIDYIPKEYIDVFTKELNQFKGISVRENKAKELLDSIITKEVNVVLDPTLLIDAERWRAISENYKPRKKYICVYSLGDISNENKVLLSDLAKENDCEIVNILEGEFYRKGPSSFLSLIDNCEFVFTDSFHAVAFSILFHKPFMVMNRKHSKGLEMGSRITGLLTSLGIKENVLVRKVSELYNLNYDEIEFNLDQKRKESISFLRDMLT